MLGGVNRIMGGCSTSSRVIRKGNDSFVAFPLKTLPNLKEDIFQI